MLRKIVLILALFLMSASNDSAAQQNVTSLLNVSPTGFVLNRSTGTFNANVTLTNNSTTTLAAPLWLVVSGLPTGVTLAQASGVTAGRRISWPPFPTMN